MSASALSSQCVTVPLTLLAPTDDPTAGTYGPAWTPEAQ